MVAGHTIGSWRKLSEAMVKQLEDCRFVLPMEEEQPAIKTRKEEHGDDGGCNYETNEEDIIEDFGLQEPYGGGWAGDPHGAQGGR